MFELLPGADVADEGGEEGETGHWQLPGLHLDLDARTRVEHLHRRVGERREGERGGVGGDEFVQDQRPSADLLAVQRDSGDSDVAVEEEIFFVQDGAFGGAHSE